MSPKPAQSISTERVSVESKPTKEEHELSTAARAGVIAELQSFNSVPKRKKTTRRDRKDEDRRRGEEETSETAER